MLIWPASALDVLLVYLCGSSVSVLENTIVEKEQLASSVTYWTDARPNMVIWLNPTSVQTENLEHVEKRVFEVLKETASKPLDMQYMRDCIRRERRQLKFSVEGSGHIFAGQVINDFLFGKRDGSTLRDLETLRGYDVIEGWTDTEWRDFLKKWISDADHVSVIGAPSANMSKKLKDDESARITARKEKLGEEGLRQLAKKLEEAKAENDKEIPSDLLTKFKVPGTDSINFIDTTTARSGIARKMGPLDNKIQKIIDADTPDLPFFIHFEH